jgi:DNA polymerase (family 10)
MASKIFAADGMLFLTPTLSPSSPSSPSSTSSTSSTSSISPGKSKEAEGGKDEVIEELTRVRGIGKKVAETLYDRGIRSIDDLLREGSPQASLVSEGVRLCAKYVDDLEEGMDQTVGELLWNYIDLLLLDPLPTSPIAKLIHSVIPVGSYRRRLGHMKDLDLLIVQSTSAVSSLPSLIVEKVSQSPLFVGMVSAGPSLIDFLVKARGKVRMIELTLTSLDYLGAALISGTGPKEYNITLRKRAERLGYKLNQNGLYRLDSSSTPTPTPTPTQPSPTDDNPITLGMTEAAILHILGLSYFPPELRGEKESMEEIANKERRSDN